MITARPARRTRSALRHNLSLPGRQEANGSAASQNDPGEQVIDRRSRRLARRRRIREEILVAAVLAVILAVTVGLLAQQWLHSTASFVSSAPATVLPGGLV